MAVETGLHCTPKTSNQSGLAKDQRNRLFWTIYAVEISLAYNLGRPPSIGEEHIAAELPKPSNENLFSLHHIRHRQIQGRVVTQVYGVNKRTRNMTTEQAQMLISSVQEELDEWRTNIPISPQSDGVHPYPYRCERILLSYVSFADVFEATGVASIMAQLLFYIDQAHSALSLLLNPWNDALDQLEATSTMY